MLGFETLTLAPIDRRLIQVEMLTEPERAWLNSYHARVLAEIGPRIEADVRASLRRLYFSASGDLDERAPGFAQLPPDGGVLANTVDPERLPAWLGEDDLDWYEAQFRQAGFRGGLNWYRNLQRNWRLTAPWHGQPIRQPSLFIAGSRDGVLKFPASKQQIEAFPRTLPGIRGCHLVEGAGHWVQQERPDEVNRLLLAFLAGL